ncbi:hypothetical protein ACIBF1_25955 [Spirillospora sp. NPDC050679]
MPGLRDLPSALRPSGKNGGGKDDDKDGGKEGKTRAVWSGVQSRVSKLTRKVRPSRRASGDEETSEPDNAPAPDARAEQPQEPEKAAKPAKAEKGEERSGQDDRDSEGKGGTSEARSTTSSASSTSSSAAKAEGKPKAKPKSKAKAAGKAGGASGGGNSSGKRRAAKPLTVKADKKTLYRRAQELDIPGRSKMSKQELAEAIRRADER